MKVLYFDCFSGISGDMFLGAMLDIGVKEEYLRQQLDLLKVSGYQLKVYSDERKGITGTRAKVQLVHEHNHNHSHHHLQHDHHLDHHHRNLQDITKIINHSQLNDHVKKISLEMFHHIAVAEAKIHGKSLNDVHFHEVGAIDSIVDIVGAAICIDCLKVDKVIFSTIAVGGGFVHCAHGIFPVPAPATVEILKGIKITSGGVEKELTTPTGAAIVKALANEFSDNKDFIIEKIGYGIGGRDNPIPNVLRVFLGKVEDIPLRLSYTEKEQAKVLECNIDDSNPEVYPYIMERLFEAGAMDVWMTPIVMKKGRTATTLSVLCSQELMEDMLNILFLETSTIGVRSYDVEKTMLKRSFVMIDTPYGSVTFKTVSYNGKEIKYKAEYEDCRRIAKEHKLPLNQVYDTVNKIYQNKK
ncbi:nickel pincer cofactor biosynthesis protein LarC [Alkaliphilus hydrothermalis]|uniref:Pyridinium-3,5-bisthiocarboxylic acid mononucleotide nickel insertion protein n=1 Tax=Alkaliphilus hydrothermalis TaxID=1482730 RepID=A0ABS2NU22_9FIRM|nr:nickel pincer cofactor biosynthesis protein LarC [Alkaliphilus hydrothermalis]MBM7616362.1 uncharacterized protein (TIGR00299 family) protein [Alkaliphilus hydrothermalis]